MAAAITDGATYIELEHAIGLNIGCNSPVHYLSGANQPTNQNKSPNAEYIDRFAEEKKEKDKQDKNDYLSVCGSSIVLSSFSDPHSQSFLRGHTSSISCCTVSPNKQLIASSQNGATPDIIIWEQGKLKYKLEEHNKGVQCMAFSDDSRFLLTAGTVDDGKMFIWDMQSGYIVTSSAIKPTPSTAAVWGGRVKDIKKRQTTDYLFATCGGELVRIWAMTPENGKLLSEKCITSNLHSRRTFTCLTFSHTADLLIAGTSTGDFFIFDVRRLTALTSYPTNCVGGIRCVASSPLQGQYVHDPLDGHFFIRIIVGCGDGAISVWEYSDDLERYIEQKKVLVHDDGGIQSLDLHDAKDKLLVATLRGNIYEINIEKVSVKETAQYPESTTRQRVHQSPPSKKVSQPKMKAISHNETSSILDVKFPSNVSDAFVTVSRDGSIRKWSIADYSIELSHDARHGNNAVLQTMCFHLNDEVIISGWNNGCIRAHNANVSNDGLLWDIKDAHAGGVSSVRLSYNDKYIISGGVDGGLRVWDIRFKKLVTHLKEHTAAINAIELYSDSRHALTCSKDRSLICWDFQTQKRISSHRMNMGSINAMKLNNTEDTVMTVGGDRSITFWDIRQAKPINCIQNAHAADVSCVALANGYSSSKRIATADAQSTLKLWDLNTFKCISQQNAYCGTINGIGFSNDDKQIVSVADDATIMLWNIFSM